MIYLQFAGALLVGALVHTATALLTGSVAAALFATCVCAFSLGIAVARDEHRRPQ